MLSRRQFLKGSLLFGGSLVLSQKALYAVQKPGPRPLPGYGRMVEAGLLEQRIKQAYSIMADCRLCPRQCGVNRLEGERGFCQAPQKVMVYSAQPHFGEEISLTGRKGSGTIFFSNCNLRCIFCQNWPIAHEGQGREYPDEGLADMMIYLQDIGCHNINLVTPTHVMPNIISAVRIAFRKGLRIPLVYNTSGYERLEMLKILDGIVDIYLPDMKYMDAEMAGKYSSEASDYPEVAQRAIVEMHRQVGLHQTDAHGIAVKGLMIRHLVMPNRVAGTEKFVRWVAQTLPKSTYVNIMSQYHVDYRAFEYEEIARGITVQEFTEAMGWARQYGLTNLDPRSLAVYQLYFQGP